MGNRSLSSPLKGTASPASPSPSMLPTKTNEPSVGTSVATSRGCVASSTTPSSIVTVPVQLPLTTSAAPGTWSIEVRSRPAPTTSPSRATDERARAVNIGVLPWTDHIVWPGMPATIRTDTRMPAAAPGCSPAIPTAASRGSGERQPANLLPASRADRHNGHPDPGSYHPGLDRDRMGAPAPWDRGHERSRAGAGRPSGGMTMSASPQLTLERRRTGWDVLFGVLSVVAGFIVLGHVALAGVISVLFTGWMLLIAGVV